EGDAKDTIWVGAGATWHDVLAHLSDSGSGRTVVVQQASDIFSIGGSLGVNCHGRTRGDGPLVSTVEEVRVMLANGTIRNVSRATDPELFNNVIGGYGMHAIILAARLKTAPDNYLRMQSETVSEAAFPGRLAEVLRDEAHELAYARVSPTFTDNLITFAAKAAPPAQSTAKGFDFERIDLSIVSRGLLATAKLSERVLSFTWDLQKHLRKHASFGWRRELLGLHANDLRMLPWCEGRNADRLFEGFLPFDIDATGAAAQRRDDSVRSFIRDMRELQVKHRSRSLNDTVRYVRADPETTLAYARADRAPGYLAFVLYYPQRINKAGSERLDALERDLVDTLQRRDGSFYLPYSRAYTPRQLRASYPRLDEALAFKKRVDPQGIFPVRITAQGRDDK
ncbi:MAG TPA: FAD-binding protein, partial [Myxococcota bacterium]|nr:FAD-binding protein [Myxococcota bacterium]